MNTTRFRIAVIKRSRLCERLREGNEFIFGHENRRALGDVGLKGRIGLGDVVRQARFAPEINLVLQVDADGMVNFFETTVIFEPDYGLLR